MRKSIEFELRVLCEDCSSDLDAIAEIVYQGKTVLTVTPCQKCLEAAADKGAKEALDEIADGKAES